VRRLARAGHFLFLTDNAVGALEEENLAHLGANLAGEVDPGTVVPFLTTKHNLDYCLMYAQRAWAQGFRALAVLGGDKSVGPPRCVSHAFQLRSLIRDRVPELTLGGWANPHADIAQQGGFLADKNFGGDFWLTQIVSHHHRPEVERLLEDVEGRGVTTPGIFGVFYYRSANGKTLERLSQFFPVPSAELTREFESGAAPEEVCARTLRALLEIGVKNIYVSNLPIRGSAARLRRIIQLATDKNS
jgi:5,10-methylenetetrahydrofolate reductase